jgi:flagellin-like hook-associated protein FlgL
MSNSIIIDVDFDEEIGDLTSLETLEKHGIDKGKQ